MRILVDGDGAAGRDIIEKVARHYCLDLLIFCDINHAIFSDYAEVKIVDSGFQSVDIILINNAQKGDIVVTQDYGVAAMSLAKKGFAISPSGYIYDEENIDRLLMERHIKAKIRRAGGKTTNAKKRTENDDMRLERNLSKLVESSLEDK
ncbi:YaiI/YqxD family protein [Clostridium oryzae]|uniref:Uncharacterized protein n=1 Tax=Clostridium oryzae TaxID=1450648 RepID=A0A1V4IXS3_9CLOT|nr:YaiI/YqxD family protein [Clostridium oryzae]OPJ64187.1 hypothetical protein CLORY_07520 [Clostridium oryzae]